MVKKNASASQHHIFPLECFPQLPSRFAYLDANSCAPSNVLKTRAHLERVYSEPIGPPCCEASSHTSKNTSMLSPNLLLLVLGINTASTYQHAVYAREVTTFTALCYIPTWNGRFCYRQGSRTLLKGVIFHCLLLTNNLTKAI